MSFPKVADLRQELAESVARMKAVVDMAKEEERDLSDDEVAEIDRLENSIPSIEAKIERMEKIDARTKALLDEKVSQAKAGDLPNDVEPSAAIKVPARAQVHRKLKAYDSEKDAYISGQLLLANLFGNRRSQEWCDNHGFQNAMVTNDNAAGGFVTTDEMQRALVRLREERGVFTQYANNVPMGADTITIPRVLSDVTAYWPGEGAEITASDLSLGEAELATKKLACLTKISSELDEDAVVDIAEMVTTSMAYAMADEVDDAAFNGDGTSNYGGFVGLKNALNANAINDAASGNTGASTLDLTDFEATVGKVGQYPGADYRWYVHSAVYWASMARLMDAGGGNRVQDLGAGPVLQFLGYPVVFTQVMPSATGASASTILCYFGDLRLGASYGTRRSMRTQVSVDRYFETDMIGIKATERIAVNIHERGDNIRNRPIVALKTASS